MPGLTEEEKMRFAEKKPEAKPAQATQQERLSEVLNCAHFCIAAGLAPSIQELHSATDAITSDWSDAAAEEAPGAAGGRTGSIAGGPAPKLHEEPVVQAAVLQVWAQFKKGADNAIDREEYEGFMLRVMRVLLPGLGTEREQRLAANAWEEDAGELEAAFCQLLRCDGPTCQGVDRLACSR